jgi:hypothetical protein
LYKNLAAKKAHAKKSEISGQKVNKERGERGRDRGVLFGFDVFGLAAFLGPLGFMQHSSMSFNAVIAILP